MEITGTLARIQAYFEEWHTNKYNALHQRTIQAIAELTENSNDKISRQKILDLANLISKKLDGDTTQITDISDITNILNKNEATNVAINLKEINRRLTSLDATDNNNPGLIQQILNKLGTDTSNGSQTIFQRLKSLESTSLSTETVTTNINNAINAAFVGNDIANGEDLNIYKTPGIYKCQKNNIATTLKCGTENSPFSKAFNLIVLKDADKGIRQILSPYDTHGIWVRRYYNNLNPQWSEWTKMYGEHNTQAFDMEVEFSSNGSKKVYTILATEVRNKTE